MKTKIVWSYILRHLTRYPGAITVMLIVACIWPISVSVFPFALKTLLDNLTALHTFPSLWAAISSPILLYLGMQTLLHLMSFRLYDYWINIRTIPRMRYHIAEEALIHLTNKTHAYFQNAFSGRLANQLNDLTSCVPDIITLALDGFLPRFLALFIAAGTLSALHPVFSVILSTFACVFITFAIFYVPRIARFADCYAECGSRITGQVVDVLTNMLSVRLFSGKQAEINNLRHTFDETVQVEQRLEWAYLWVWAIYGILALSAQACAFYFLYQGYQAGWVKIGDFALVIGINSTIFDFLWHLAKDISQFSKLYGRITQALRAILEAPESIDAPNAVPLIVSRGQITFDAVQFHYQHADLLFQGKSLIIPSGQKVGLVGYSGSGKSTFVNLILRLYEIQAGHILIDDQDIRHATQDSLHDQIAMIPQDPSLFHRSLLENIRYGRVTASDEEVIEAAKQAYAHDFISLLPQGYASFVGERGVKLSGGQRQRIAIARAILKNAPILILDEATSQLDSVTEEHIQASLWQVMQNKTTIIIAHRLSTLLAMDRILVFDQGKIVQDGSHTQLLQQAGLYQTLWAAQVGGFLPEGKPGVNI